MARGMNSRRRTPRAYRLACRAAGRGEERGRSRPGDSVRRVRRLAVLALVTAFATGATVGLTAAPASAHICPIAVEIPVGQPSTIDVGVTVEGATVPDVEITIPAGLRLDRVDPKAGWTFTRTGSTVRYRGGPIAPYTCEYFSLGVTAPARGAFGIPVVQRTAERQGVGPLDPGREQRPVSGPRPVRLRGREAAVEQRRLEQPFGDDDRGDRPRRPRHRLGRGVGSPDVAQPRAVRRRRRDRR